MRKLKKYSDNFNEMFTFFLKGYRSGLLAFCGSAVNTKFDVDGDEGKFCFRKLENGEYKQGEIPITRHSNILKGVITGKKGWGLWVDQWSDGIVEWSFTEEEILGEFQKRNIQIPEPLLLDFKNRIKKKKEIRNQKNSEFLGSGGMWK